MDIVLILHFEANFAIPKIRLWPWLSWCVHSFHKSSSNNFRYLQAEYRYILYHPIPPQVRWPVKENNPLQWAWSSGETCSLHWSLRWLDTGRPGKGGKRQTHQQGERTETVLRTGEETKTLREQHAESQDHNTDTLISSGWLHQALPSWLSSFNVSLINSAEY